MMRNKKGFTLTELLVVLAIITVLMAVILPSMSAARARARDDRRRADLEVIAGALKMHKERYGTFRVSGAGNGGNGIGWFSLQSGSSYPKSIARGLVDAGVLSAAMTDPNGLASAPSDGTGQDGGNRKGRSAYMIQADAGSFTLWASLERPTPEDIATQGQCAHSTYDSGSYNPNPTSNNAKYGMNYCISN